MPSITVKEDEGSGRWWVCIAGNPYRSFATKDAALAECVRLQEMLFMKSYLHLVEGTGKVLDISPDGWWIQNRGRGFVALPHPDFDFEIGQNLEVDKNGNIGLILEHESGMNFGR